MDYVVVKKANPLVRSEVKYYASPVYGQKTTLREIADELSDASTLNTLDIMAVIEGFLKMIAKYTVKGSKVFLGDLGHFRLTFTSEGKETAQNVSAGDISGVRIVFRSSAYLKDYISKNTTFSVYEPKNTEKGKKTSE